MSRMAGTPRPRGPQTQQYQFGPWTLTASKSHILESEGPERENDTNSKTRRGEALDHVGLRFEFYHQLADPIKDTRWYGDCVSIRKFESELELPQLPEMIFAENKLKVEHKDGFGLTFNALDALRRVDPHEDPFRVAASEEWQNARSDCEHIKNIVKPFDWTYSTDYKGTLLSSSDKPGLNVVPTTERIDIEKLKQREKIMFYDDVLLFEDELSDNGSSMINVKIRVMPSSFFILMRFFMRVDDVIIRVNDTRIYHEGSMNYILREFTSKDDKVENIKASPHLFHEPNEIHNHLTLRSETYEKLEFPAAIANDS